LLFHQSYMHQAVYKAFTTSLSKQSDQSADDYGIPLA